jgi:hypothetical protein
MKNAAIERQTDLSLQAAPPMMVRQTAATTTGTTRMLTKIFSSISVRCVDALLISC